MYNMLPEIHKKNPNDGHLDESETHYNRYKKDSN